MLLRGSAHARVLSVISMLGVPHFILAVRRSAFLYRFAKDMKRSERPCGSAFVLAVVGTWVWQSH